MIRTLRRFGLPLLAKELIEQAARRRTYILRVVYAILLFAASFLLFYETLRIGNVSPLAVLGRGREMFVGLVAFEFVGVYLFMPAITCSVIAHEKERQSLQLLLLTRLGPWSILFEKFLSRLVPMFCFLLLSLPLLAFAYSLGGISREQLLNGVWLLMITVVQMGTLALCCSTFFRTTVGAFVASYLLGVVMLFGPVFIAMLLIPGPRQWSPQLQHWLIEHGVIDDPEQIFFPFFAPIHVAGLGGPSRGMNTGVVTTALRTTPILLISGVFLLLSRAFLVRRAFLPPRNLVLGFFKLLDRTFSRLNENRVTRGIMIIRDKSKLPDWRPIAWRETTKRSLGRTHYLFRIFLAIEIPLCVVLLLIALLGNEGATRGATVMLFVLWPLAVLMVSVCAASLIAGERTHQTLDVLCTTPIAGREILRQKFQVVRRLTWVLSIPFFTIFVFEAWWRSSTSYPDWRGEHFRAVLYLICSALSVFVYLPMIAWLSLLIGLVIRTQARAIIAALGTIVGWCLLPFVFIMLPLEIMAGPIHSNSGLTFFTLLSPLSIVPFNEFAGLQEFAELPWLAVIVNFTGYGAVLALLRQACLANADRFLGRLELTGQAVTIT